MDAVDPVESLGQLLLGSASPSTAQLASLSDLPMARLEEAKSVWRDAPVELRRRLLAALRELAEDNIEYNFRAVFLLGLDDPDPEVRVKAVEGLWEDESLLVMERLERLLLSDPSPDVRAAAATELGRFAFKASCGDLQRGREDELQETLRRALVRSPDGSLPQMRALEALAYFHDDPLVPEYIRRLYREGDEEEQASALAAMGHTAQPGWAPLVEGELDSESNLLRFHAACAAGEIGLAGTVPALRRIAGEDDPEVRNAAIWALGQVGTRQATETLRALAGSESEEVREAAEEALGEAMYAGDHE